MRAEIKDLKATLQKRREKEFKQEAIKKNCDRKWPYNLTIHDERQVIESVSKSLQLLHKDSRAPNEHINWLREQIKEAFKTETCERYLLNHLAFFEERISSKALFDFKS